MISAKVFSRLRNKSIREIISALERDGFVLKRSTKKSNRIYAHEDGRITVIHYHHSSDTLPPGTLKSIFSATQWTDDDAKRLKLL